MTRRSALLLLPVALALLAATRLPRPGWPGLVLACAILAAVVLALLLLRATPPRWASPGLAVALVAAILVPPTRAALAPDLPAFLPPLAALAFLAALHPPVRARAPSGEGRQRVALLRRWMPLLLLVPALLALPAALRWALPERLALLHELDGAALPLLAAAILVVPLLAWAWLRDAAQLRRDRAEAGKAPEAP